VNVSAEAAVALPTRLRPTTEQVCDWYVHTLQAIGADVERTGAHEFEFTLPVSKSFFNGSLAAALAPLAGGELEVAETDNGFEVLAQGRARSWVTVMPIVVFAAATLFVGPSLGWLPAACGLGLLGFTWLRTRGALDRFLDATNSAIADSFATIPPVAHDLPLHRGARLHTP